MHVCVYVNSSDMHVRVGRCGSLGVDTCGTGSESNQVCRLGLENFFFPIALVSVLGIIAVGSNSRHWVSILRQFSGQVSASIWPSLF